MTAAPGNPERLIRRSVAVATNRLGSRKSALRAVVQVARVARGAAVAAEGRAGIGVTEISSWLDEVVRAAEVAAELDGVDVEPKPGPPAGSPRGRPPGVR